MMGLHCDTCTCEEAREFEGWLGVPLMLGYCPAEAQIGQEHLSCQKLGHHLSPHDAGWLPRPCPTCGGLESHTRWCSDDETTTNEVVRVFFDSSGPDDPKAAYWVEPRYGEKGLPSR